MIKHIYKLATANNCLIHLVVSPDGTLQIFVGGKHNDSLIVGAGWSKKTLKGCIEDAVRRANDD